MIKMSNFEFLVADAEQVGLYPWFKTLNKEARAAEQDYIEGSINRMLRDCRTALEFAVQKYMSEMNITVKKQNFLSRNQSKKARKNGSSDSIHLSGEEDEKLMSRINAIRPAGSLLPAAHFIRKTGNEAIHNIEYVGNGRDYDCIKNLHDVILWIYNQLTQQEVISEFSLDRIDSKILYTERERLQEAAEEVIQKRVSQRKKKRKIKKKNKNKDAFHIETYKNEFIIVNSQNQEVFVFEDSHKDEKITEMQLPATLDHMKYMLAEIKVHKGSVENLVREYEQENQYALSEIQLYINEFQLGKDNTQVMMEYFSAIQKEQHEGLEEVVRRIEENLRDKEACIQFLEQLSEDQNVQMELLYLKIRNLEKNIEDLLKEMKDFQTQEKPQLLSTWIQQVKGNFTDDKGTKEQERTYSREQFERVYLNFKQQYNRVSFLYESEKMVRQKQEYELADFHYKLGEQKEVNRKLTEDINVQKMAMVKNRRKYRSLMRLMRYFSLSLLILIIILIILFLWQRERAQVYREQYDEVMSLLENGNVNTKPVQENDEELPLVEDTKEPLEEEETNNQESSETVAAEETNNQESTKNVAEEKDKVQNKEKGLHGKIVDGIYFSENGDYQISVPTGWELYPMDTGVYLGTNAEILESDMFYVNMDPYVAYEDASMNWYINYWGDENIFFVDFDYGTYGGFPCIKSYSYVSFEINDIKGGNYLLTYTILADKEYEFYFVDRDNAGDLYVTAEAMMDSLVFLGKDPVTEPTEIILGKLAEDMLETYFIRRNYEETLIHLTKNYQKELEDTLYQTLVTLPDPSHEFYYEVQELQVDGDEAEAKIYMQWENMAENYSTMKFVKEGNSWKINYFDK